jgi:hypothetical protein
MFRKKLSIMILIILLTIYSLCNATEIDTIFAAGPPLTGEISNFNYNYELQVDFLALIAGDTGMPWIPPYVPNAVFRTYLAFPLDSLNIESGVDSVKLILWSHNNTGIVGNDNWGEWPIWDVPGGDTIKLCIDHIDYGDYLDIGDWTAGDPGDPQTLESKCAFITPEIYNPETGYFIVNVTNSVINDIENDRNKTQFRIRFEINTDGDSLYDSIGFRKSMIEPEKAPHLNFYVNTNSVDNVINSFDETNLTTYPNPFNQIINIQYKISQNSNVLLQVFNVKGQLIETIVNEYQNSGKHHTIWNASQQRSGIYFLSIKTSNQTKICKCLFLK